MKSSGLSSYLTLFMVTMIILFTCSTIDSMAQDTGRVSSYSKIGVGSTPDTNSTSTDANSTMDQDGLILERSSDATTDKYEDWNKFLMISSFGIFAFGIAFTRIIDHKEPKGRLVRYAIPC